MQVKKAEVSIGNTVMWGKAVSDDRNSVVVRLFMPHFGESYHIYPCKGGRELAAWSDTRITFVFDTKDNTYKNDGVKFLNTHNHLDEKLYQRYFDLLILA